MIWNLPRVLQMPFAEIEEDRPVLLVTSPPAWDAVKTRLKLPVAARVEPGGATVSAWNDLLSQAIRNGPDEIPFSVIYAVGGGLAADCAKYLAARLDLPMVCLPTALSVDAFLTPGSGVRREGCVHYIETKPAESLVLDLEVIAAAPAPLRAAGIADVLSIYTGCWDWRFAQERGMNPPGMELVPWVYDCAQTILDAALGCAEAAGRGDHPGLKTLFDCLALEVQLCNQIGHSRPEEGSEHYFAYAVENETGPGLPHGALVGPGILIAARLQGQDAARIEAALDACSVPLGRVPEEAIAHTLARLPQYSREHDLPFGIVHTL